MNDKELLRNKLHRWTGAILTVVVFILYMLSTDPDFKVINNLPFGVGLLLSLQAVFMTMLMFVVIELGLDYIMDIIYPNEPDLVKKARETSEGAGQVALAKSVRILGYCIIGAAAIIATRT